MAGVKSIIIQLFEGETNAEEAFIIICADIAEAHINNRSAKERYLINLLGLSNRDFAIDSIADIFKKRDNRFIVLEKYFGLPDLLTASEGEVFIELRKLVFSQVNDHIFAMYNEVDPSLGKIIRNIKRGLKEGTVDGLVYRESDKTIIHKELKTDLVVMPHPLLKLRYHLIKGEIRNTTDALKRLRKVFELNPEYAARIHTSSFALILRELFAHLMEESFENNVYVQNEFFKGELEKFITRSVNSVKYDLYKSYVISEKISDKDFSAYFIIVTKILKAEYISDSVVYETYYDAFSSIYENVTKIEYRSDHRKYLEYFVSKVKNQVLIDLQNELYSARK